MTTTQSATYNSYVAADEIPEIMKRATHETTRSIKFTLEFYNTRQVLDLAEGLQSCEKLHCLEFGIMSSVGGYAIQNLFSAIKRSNLRRIHISLYGANSGHVVDTFCDMYDSTPRLVECTLFSWPVLNRTRWTRINTKRAMQYNVLALFTHSRRQLPVTRFLRRDGDNALMWRVMQYMLPL